MYCSTFVKGEDKVWVVILRNAWLVPLLRRKTKFDSNLKYIALLLLR